MSGGAVRAAGLWAALVLCLMGSSLWAEVRGVSSPDALRKALQSATPGTVIALEPGNYGALRLQGFDAGGPVTLRSADQDAPARFAAMTLKDVRDLHFDQVTFDYTFTPGDPIALRPFQILNSTHISIRSALFDGDVARGRSTIDDGTPTAFGLGVRDSRHITLKDSEIRGFFRGTVMSQTDHILLSGNEVHGIRSDGMNFAEVKHLRVEGNHIHDFVRVLASDDHADMIQFWTSRTKTPSRDVIIRDNVLNSGDGLFTQSIFLRNDLVDTGQAGPEMFYEDFTIENNFILNAHLHGITVGEARGLRIRNNTLVRNARSEGPRDIPGLYTPQIRISDKAEDVEITRNVTFRVVGAEAQPDWHVADNFLVQDVSPRQPGYYGAVFGPEALEDPTRVENFVPLAGGLLSGRGVGAQLSQ